jgi:hydroxymethylpyrimidine pyrophosphatase-like HAD family hydrolase
VRPLEALVAAEATRLVGVIFDLDDTLLDHGALSEEAYGSLFLLRRAGLRLLACTGRPAGWGEVIQRMWPLDATVVENGALAWVPGSGGQLEAIGRTTLAACRARRAQLEGLAAELVARFPDAALADDNGARVTDVTLDIGEHRHVGAAEVAAMRAIAHARGVRTFQSSVHVHLTYETDDKASGLVALLARRFGDDPTTARLRYAYVGDSANDGVAFAAFATTFGVANVRRHLAQISVPPRYVAAEPMGRGFSAIARRLAHLRLGG